AVRRGRGRKTTSGNRGFAARACQSDTSSQAGRASAKPRTGFSRGSERHVESFETRGTRLSGAQAPQQSDTADPVREPQRPSPLARMLIRLSALVLIGAILFVFHGIRYYLDPWSQAIITGLVKYIYPSDGQAETTVVLFREENLRMLKEPYPVSYERHAEILEALSIYHPRAVFLDFVFLDKRSREATETLRQAICNLRE